MGGDGNIPVFFVDPKIEERLRRKREKQRIYDRRRREAAGSASQTAPPGGVQLQEPGVIAETTFEPATGLGSKAGGRPAALSGMRRGSSAASLHKPERRRASFSDGRKHAHKADRPQARPTMSPSAAQFSANMPSPPDALISPISTDFERLGGLDPLSVMPALGMDSLSHLQALLPTPTTGTWGSPIYGSSMSFDADPDWLPTMQGHLSAQQPTKPRRYSACGFSDIISHPHARTPSQSHSQVSQHSQHSQAPHSLSQSLSQSQSRHSQHSHRVSHSLSHAHSQMPSALVLPQLHTQLQSAKNQNTNQSVHLNPQTPRNIQSVQNDSQNIQSVQSIPQNIHALSRNLAGNQGNLHGMAFTPISHSLPSTHTMPVPVHALSDNSHLNMLAADLGIEPVEVLDSAVTSLVEHDPGYSSFWDSARPAERYSPWLLRDSVCDPPDQQPHTIFDPTQLDPVAMEQCRTESAYDNVYDSVY